MPQVGFEPTMPVFERAKTVHALDRAATLIGLYLSLFYKETCGRILLVLLKLFMKIVLLEVMPPLLF
jgi:hypothetical protein